MSSKIIIKNSQTASSVPTTSEVDVGELAVNVADKVIYTKDGSSNVVQLGAEEYITSARAAQWDTAYTTAPGSINANLITSGQLPAARLSGSYTINITGNVTGNVTSSGTSTFNTIQIGTNWTVTESNNRIYFRYNGASKASIDENGLLRLASTVTESTTP